MMVDRLSIPASMRPHWRWLVLGVMLIAAGLRVYGAWAGRLISDPDGGVVALMARHIALGDSWPVFFYGQSYMGSLEPIISGLLCRILGINGFAVCLGTALAGILCLPVIYSWARHMGGGMAGLFALLLCLAGPYDFYMFQFTPRGGYMMTLLLGLLVMSLSAHMAQQLLSGERPGLMPFALIGALAGLGWWTNQLIIPALAASAVILAVALRGKLLKPPVLIGLVFFVMGSLPYWLWNIHHDWASFEMAGELGKSDFSDGLNYFWLRLHQLGGSRHMESAFPACYAWIADVFTLLATVYFARKCLRSPSARYVHHFMIILFLFFSLLLFSVSGFAKLNTSRYLIPLVPASSILISCYLARAVQHPAGRILYVVPALLVFCQFPAVHDMWLTSRTVDKRLERFNALEKGIHDAGLDTVYAPFQLHHLNFHLHESIAFNTITGERYLPILRQSESARAIGVINNMGPLSEFTWLCGGSWNVTSYGPMTLFYDIEPPVGTYEKVPSDQVASVRDFLGAEIMPLVTDLNRDSVWTRPHVTSEEVYIHVEFSQPVPLKMIRFSAPDNDSYPVSLIVDVRDAQSGQWSRVHSERQLTRYFWSGSRLYWSGPEYRLEILFPGQTIDAVRLLQGPDEDNIHINWQVSELQFFVEGEGTLYAGRDDFAGLKAGSEVYADRWIAARLRDSQPDLIIRGGPEDQQAGRVILSDKSVFIVHEPDTASMDQVLESMSLNMRKSIFKDLTVYSEPSVAGRLPLRWNGLHLEKGFTRDCFLDELLKLKKQTPSPVLLSQQLNALYNLYPEGADLFLNFVDLLDHKSSQADQLLSLAREAGSPEIEVDAAFDNGVTLLGITLSSTSPEPDSVLDIHLFWTCPEELDPVSTIVFMHFLRDNDILMQDDHRLLEPLKPIDFERQPFSGEVYHQVRRVHLPSRLEPGPLSIGIGMYDNHTGKRLSVTSPLPHRKGRVDLEGLLDVMPRHQ